MTLSIIKWEMLKTTEGTYKIVKYKTIKSYPNDFFDDKIDIFSEKDWLKFLVNYRGEVRLTQYDKDGVLLCWSIIARGCRRDIREHFNNSRQTTAYLFPQSKNFKGENINKLMDYNIKYLYPRIPKMPIEENQE